MKPIRNASYEMKLDDGDLVIEQCQQVIAIPISQIPSFIESLIEAKTQAEAMSDETFSHQVKPR